MNINLGTDGSSCGIQSITRPDGSVAYGVDTLVFEVDQNGDYDFFVWDRCGNLLKYTCLLYTSGHRRKAGADPAVLPVFAGECCADSTCAVSASDDGAAEAGVVWCAGQKQRPLQLDAVLCAQPAFCVLPRDIGVALL